MEHSPTDHILSHKANLNKAKRIEITQNRFSDQSGIKLKIYNRKRSGKFTDVWKLHNTLLNNPRVKEEVSREIESTSVWSWYWVWCKGSWHGPAMKHKQEPGPRAPKRRTHHEMWEWCSSRDGVEGVGWALGWENSEEHLGPLWYYSQPHWMFCFDKYNHFPGPDVETKSKHMAPFAVELSILSSSLQPSE